MRQAIKKLINKFGYNISKIDKKFENINMDELLSKKINNINPLIFDVGGNTGQSILKFKKIFKDPIIHSFEPNKAVFDIMNSKFMKDNKVFCNNFALGDKIENKDFNITEKTGKSSFYNLNTDKNWYANRNERYTTFVTAKKKVQVYTIDNYCNDNKIENIDLLKMDTQGYEEKILEGSKDALKNSKIKFVIAEIIFNDFYDKYFLFSDIEKYLVPNNFRLVGMEINNNNIFQGAQFGANVYYMNKKFYNI